MKLVDLSPEDNKSLKRVKRELLTDENATFTSYGKCNDKLKVMADKYGVSVNEVYHSIKD